MLASKEIKRAQDQILRKWKDLQISCNGILNCDICPLYSEIDGCICGNPGESTLERTCECCKGKGKISWNHKVE